MLLKRIAMILSIFLLCSCSPKEKITTNVLGDFSVTCLKVGQADALILKTINHTILIDTGEKDDDDTIIDYLEKNSIDTVDYLFITHFDKDHIGGAKKILSNMEVKEIYEPTYTSSGKDYEKYINYLNENSITTNKITENTTLNVDDLLINIYPAKRDNYEQDNDNNQSLVISVIHGKNSFLFAGDIEDERISEITPSLEKHYDFLKLPHHGIYSKGTKNFISRISPKFAVSCSSEKNPYDDMIKYYVEKNGGKFYSTQAENQIFISNGKEIIYKN